MTNSKTLTLDNNESLTRGVFPQEDGTFLAMTFSRSRTFKTEAGAWKWFEKQPGGFKRANPLLEIGRTYVSGNTFRPTESTLVAVDVAFADIGEREQRIHRSLAATRVGANAETARYVVFMQNGRREATEIGVWLGTRYESAEAMSAAYIAKRPPLRHLPGALLPGDR